MLMSVSHQGTRNIVEMVGEEFKGVVMGEKANMRIICRPVSARIEVCKPSEQ
jgi:hypothetical protein